jgi:corrinoid protein of di/trimethylamine methyltransferase
MSAELLRKLHQAILDYDPDESAALTGKALEEGHEADLVMKTLITAIREIGDGFGTGELFLPDLVGGADALQAAMPLVLEAYKQSGVERESEGVIVIGTVAGDIHTIGKSMVTSMLTAEGFEVHDIGIDVSAEQFIEAIKEFKPQIVAMSALLTTTAPMAKKVIEQLEECGLRDSVKVMVGGGAITEPFAESIGADGYDPTAPGAVLVARNLITSMST